MSLLELNDVAFSYAGNRKVLDELSFKVDQGTITAILGPNGAGKSTILDICLGWRSPDSGTIHLKQKALGSWSRRQRGRLMSLVPQHENVRFDFSVFEYVLLGRAPHLGPLAMPGDVDTNRVQRALEEAGIIDLAERSITTLSGGEYQLMLIARSLSQQSELLLLDEPTSDLDPANQLLIIRMLKKLTRAGKSVLYTSHDPQSSALAADSIHLLKDGQFAYSGPAKQIFTNQTLSDVYGVPFDITWIDGFPLFRWKL